MAQPFIVIGDQTDHGGQVVEGSPTTTTGGKSIARVGDQVTCPQHGHGPTTIVSGDETMLIDGKPAARHGDKCACGATLIASQMVSTAGGDGGASSGSASGSSGSNAGSTANSGKANGAAAGPTAAPPAAAAYDQRFLVKDKATGKPLANAPYRISIAATGQAITGQTDGNGLTGTISAAMPFTATLEVPYHADNNSAADTDDGHDACGC